VSTFEDFAVIDLFPHVDPEPVLSAMDGGGFTGSVWIDTLPDGRVRIGLHLPAGDAQLILDQRLPSVAGEHIARVLVENNFDEHGMEHVVLANRDGQLLRTHDIHVQPRTDDGVPDSFIYLLTDPSVPSDLLDDYSDEVRADPTKIVDYPELRDELRSDGHFGFFPVDEGLANESDDLDAVLDGPMARARTTALFGVEPGALDKPYDPTLCFTRPFHDWWEALRIDQSFMDGAPHKVLAG
jgi:hypothetical protein